MARAWIAVGLVGAVALAGAFGAVTAWPVGPSLVEVTNPLPGDALADVALDVLVQFPHADRTRPETLRVELNGADVTDGFDVADNGAIGKVVLLVDGENRLHVRVFGRSWWPGSRLVEHTEEVRFRVERRIDRYWAGVDGPRGGLTLPPS
jgi:hypothetical protein